MVRLYMNPTDRNIVCNGVARRVALHELLADVMVLFVESRASKPAHWKELKA
jgi:hypothetical protein